VVLWRRVHTQLMGHAMIAEDTSDTAAPVTSTNRKVAATAMTNVHTPSYFYLSL